jgi:hypothetical protein
MTFPPVNGIFPMGGWSYYRNLKKYKEDNKAINGEYDYDYDYNHDHNHNHNHKNIKGEYDYDFDCYGIYYENIFDEDDTNYLIRQVIYGYPKGLTILKIKSVTHWKHISKDIKYIEHIDYFADFNNENESVYYNQNNDIIYREYDDQIQYYKNDALYKTIIKELNGNTTILYYEGNCDNEKQVKSEEFNIDNKLIVTKIYNNETLIREEYPNGDKTIIKHNKSKIFLKSSDNNEINQNKCAICFDNISNCVFNECGHVVICKTCRNDIIIHERNDIIKCPICRKLGKIIELY